MPQAVYFLLLPNVLSLDVSGPAETLRLAGSFSLRYLSPCLLYTSPSPRD